jgi:peroxiredoxin
MRAWAQATVGCIASGIIMVADGNGDYTKALGFDVDKTKSRMGVRSQRYAAIIENGIVKSLNIDTGSYGQSSAENILTKL